MDNSTPIDKNGVPPVDIWRALPPLAEGLREQGLGAKKSFGQNFLFDQQITDKIVGFLPALSQGSLLEIGPGPGGLTRSLLMHHKIDIVALEADQDMIALLEPLRALSAPRLQIIKGDACAMNLATLLKDQPRYLQANLPFHIATPLILSLLHQAHAWKEWVFMVQKEVGERLLAPHNSKTYGKLSVLAQSVCTCERLMLVQAAAFHPKPKVDAMVVRITPKEEWSQERLSILLPKLEALLHCAFHARRKKVCKTLAQHFALPMEKMEALGITDDMRADHVSVQCYKELAELMASEEFCGRALRK